MDARYWDIGTVMDYWNTSRHFLRGDENAVGSLARIAGSAAVSRSILWDDIQIGEAAVIEECIVTDGVRVVDDARFRRMILIREADGRTSATPFMAV